MNNPLRNTIIFSNQSEIIILNLNSHELLVDRKQDLISNRKNQFIFT